jgi:hypothetical protein
MILAHRTATLANVSLNNSGQPIQKLARNGTI